MPRRSLLIPLGILLACLVAVPACKKKPADSGDPGPGPGPGVPPATVSSDSLLFAHLKAKDIRDSTLFTEVKQAFTKAGGTAEWDQIDSTLARVLGVKLTDIESLTVCVTEVPEEGEPKMVVILASDKPITKSGAFGLDANAKPDSRGFYKAGRALAHFPDEKTLAIVHPDLAQKYLDGYAKDRTTWPFTAELSKAAAGHTLFATVQLQKVPTDMLSARETKDFAPLLAARTVTLTADLKGKELSAAARATFADATAAGKAKDKAQELIGLATDEIGKFMNGKVAGDFATFMPAVKEAERALKATKVEVSGSDLTATATYKADFDFGAVVADAVKKVREAAARMKASNNLKQAALGLHSYHDSMGRFPIHGTGANGAPLQQPTDKPLLSWRVAILPYIEQANLYNQFKLNEPWDSDHNKKLIDKMPNLYAPTNKPGKPGYTHMQMVIGPKAMQPRGLSLLHITDGTSNTIAMVEAADAVIWTKPDDVMLTGKESAQELKKRFGGQFPNGFNVAFWDGSVWFVSDSTNDKTLRGLLSPSGGEVLDSDR